MHTLGAFAVIFDREGQVLLCHRTDQYLWNLPGGRVETGESPWQAVVREVIEEVGLQIQVERVLGIYSVPERGDLVFTFLCVPVGGVILTSEEADEVRWFTRNTIPSNTSRRQLERIEDAYANSNSICLTNAQQGAPADRSASASLRLHGG